MDEIIDQMPQKEQRISFSLDLSKFKKVKQGNKRAEMINRMTVALGIAPQYRKGLVMQTQNKITDSEMEFIFTKALAFKKNPPAYFRVLIKQKLQELKNVVK